MSRRLCQSLTVVLALAAATPALAQKPTRPATSVQSGGMRQTTPDEQALMDAFRAARRDMNAGRYAQAAARFRDVTDRAVAMLGADHEQTLIARSWLAFALFNAGDRHAAYPEAHRVTAAATALSPDHEALDRVRPMLAAERLEAGDAAAAASILETSLERNLRLGDRDQASGVATLLAQVYRMSGRITDADVVMARVDRVDDDLGPIDIQGFTWGPLHDS